MDKKTVGKIIGATAAVIGTAFVAMSIVAKAKKGSSVYDDEPEQKNPLQGKKVVFVPDENDDENADGARGHLEAVGESDYKPGVYDKYFKRAIDIVLSFGGLVVLSPVYAAIALAIKIDDPGPVLFTQKRMGQNKEYFKLHKFRSMKMCTPHDVPTHMLENPDQYITKVGKFLRAHSLDELPQIWDIFIGNMSVIGPRPGLWNQDILTAERDKYGANDVKPGLTGWAQINGRDELEIPDKAKLDGEYVDKLGLGMDIKCFLGSVGVFAHDDSVVEGGTGEMSKIGRHYTDGKSDEELIGHIGFGETVEVDKSAHKKVLITGADSYIGESFCAYVSEKYADNFTIDTIDMLDDVWRNTNFSKYDIVYHVAGIAHADVGNVSDDVKENYYAVNTDLTVEVAEKAKKEGVKEFIFMSSMIVYGESAPYGKSKIIDENTVPKPANFYGDSKLQADVAIRELADDSFKVIVLRPPMIYGRGSKGNYPLMAKLAKKLPVFPDVDNERSMLYIENLCEFLCQVMLIKSFERNAVVLVPQNAEWTKTSEMVKEISAARGKNIRLMTIMKPVVFLGGKMSGKIGMLVNKAFGNNCYAQSISEYEWISYRVSDLRKSINRTEGNIKSGYIDNKVGEDGLVSVIMPAYNAEKYIAESIESVINQSYTNWELIIVDDCSNDKTSIVVERYSKQYSRIKLIRHKVNSGSAVARNTAIAAARGRYIAFLDSDDLWVPSKLSEQIDFMQKNEYAFTFTGYESFSSQDLDNVICEFAVPTSINYDQYLRNTIIGNLTVVLDRWMIPDVHVEIGELEDVLTWMYYLKRGYVAYGFKKNLAKYRVYSTSKSGNKFRNAKRYYNCLRKYQNLSIIKSIVCEVGYIYNALLKRIKGKQ